MNRDDYLRSYREAVSRKRRRPWKWHDHRGYDRRTRAEKRRTVVLTVIRGRVRFAGWVFRPMPGCPDPTPLERLWMVFGREPGPVVEGSRLRLLGHVSRFKSPDRFLQPEIRRGVNVYEWWWAVERWRP